MDPAEIRWVRFQTTENQTCSVTPILRRFILLFLIIGIAVIVIVTRSRDKSEPSLNETHNPRFCQDPKCKTATNLLRSMDLRHNPCEDFYSFVCGNWIKDIDIEKEPRITQFSQVNGLIYLRIREILESHYNPEAPEHENKAKTFYQSCIDVETRERTKFKILLKDLKRFGGWPLLETNWDESNFDWSELLVQFYRNGYPVNMLLGIGVGMDITNTSTSLIQITQPTLGLGERWKYLFNGYQFPYGAKILQLLFRLSPALDIQQSGTFTPALDAAQEIHEVFELERWLADGTVEISSKRNLEQIYNIFTLNETEEFAPKIPWRDLLTKLLPPGTELHDNQRMMIEEPSALDALNKILLYYDNPERRRVLANYMFYRAATFAAAYYLELEPEPLFTLGDKFSRVEDEEYDFGNREVPWTCVERTKDFFYMSVTATYAKQYMDNHAKSYVEMMFQDIQESLMEDIKEAKWLDKETIEGALLKVKNIQSTIEYGDNILSENKLNDYYSSLEVGEDYITNIKAVNAFNLKKSMKGLNILHHRSRWSYIQNSVLSTNAFYYPPANSILVAVGALEYPFFLLGRPNYMNYGGLGSLVGHEFTHAFDREGGMFDENGNYRMWWTYNSWESYKERTDCYVQQYAKYYDLQVHSFVNGTNTVNENIADNGGLLIAYRAYQKMLDRIKKEEKLSGLDFSERQMFWISFASSWCRRQSDDSLNDTIHNDVHAPGRFRVNGALSNMEEFAEDFKCKKGSALNPETRCSFWK